MGQCRKRKKCCTFGTVLKKKKFCTFGTVLRKIEMLYIWDSVEKERNVVLLGQCRKRNVAHLGQCGKRKTCCTFGTEN